MSRLNLGTSNSSGSNDVNEHYVSPWNVDNYCNHHSETALHAAVRNKYAEIASLLLAAGANPNLSIYPLEMVRFLVTSNVLCLIEYNLLCVLMFQNSKTNGRSSSRGETTTALVVACNNKDLTMVELLLKYDARDDDAKALSVAIKYGDDMLITKLLVIKVRKKNCTTV